MNIASNITSPSGEQSLVRAIAWTRGMVADGFAFELSNPAAPGDLNSYTIVPAATGAVDASDRLIEALAARGNGHVD